MYFLIFFINFVFLLRFNVCRNAFVLTCLGKLPLAKTLSRQLINTDKCFDIFSDHEYFIDIPSNIWYKTHIIPQNKMFLVLLCSCLCSIHWSQVLNREWRCNWSSASAAPSTSEWSTILLPTKGVAYITDLTILLIYRQRSFLFL